MTRTERSLQRFVFEPQKEKCNMAEVYSDKGTHTNVGWIVLAVIAALVLAIILYAVL
jgi:hypothetical protein